MKARVLHVIGQLTRGGAERQLSYLARELQARGWAQSVVSLSRGGTWKDYLLTNSIPVFEIDQHPFKPYRLWSLYRIARQERPHIILSWSPHAGVYAHWLMGVGRPLLVFSVRGDLTVDSDTGRPGGRFSSARHSIERADHVVSNSSQSLAVLRENGLDLANSSVIRNIVFAAGRSSGQRGSSQLRIVAAGTLNQLKAYDVLLHALSIVAANGEDYELVLAGNGPEWANLNRLAAELGLSERVHFLGEVDDVPALFATAQLAVHPSRSEGLSNAILEAMAEGLPVVATAVGGAREIVEDGRNGLLVPSDEPEYLAHAIQRLLRDGELRARLGHAALQWVRDSCSEDIIGGEYDRLFCRLLHESQKVQS